MFERLIPEPEPPRKIVPSLVFQPRIDSIVSSTLRMKQAEHCGCSSKPTLNQTGRVEGGLLVQQDVGQLVLEGVAVGGGGEVAELAAPVGDRAGDAADHLLDGVLTLGRAERAAEVLLGDDVGRVLRPGHRELEVALLEGGRGGVADEGVALLPGDLVEGRDALRGESPLDLQTAFGDPRRGVDRAFRGCVGHLSSPLKSLMC